MADGKPILGSLYVYAPNKGAPIFFAVAFGMSAVFHIWQCFRYKAFKLIGLHPLCAVLFTAGYALREYGAYNYIYDPNTPSLILFVLSQVLIFICPPLLELANYHILGRIFYYIPHKAPLPPSRVLAIFGALMALVEALNAIGVALQANPSSAGSQQKLGSDLTIAAISIQIGVIVAFLIMAGVFHWRCKAANMLVKTVKTPVLTLYTSMTLIFIRCIYRLVEHLGPTSIDLRSEEKLKSLTPVLRYEWYFYVFEATLMLLNSVLWNIWNAARYLPKSYAVHITEDGREVIAGSDTDGRSSLAKIGNVFTFGILFRREVRTGTFHELNHLPAL
ncbi:hypothetical protein VHEMI08945 [[Torrubiella] hemipterigena]|uniref:RTA1 domain protein n=1 Tax=[Torrubiella] hemipterigena TaxID=1531966 RepID=A0A0A1TQL6_9HYPO|nr:hypothetical protein VHEMI08945 [[Torrubiella] hemipterigena]